MKKFLLLCCLLFAACYSHAQSCTASISATQSPSGNNLLNVAFTNSSNYGFPFSGQGKSYNIDYGDGVVLTNQGGTSIASHVYPTPGTYTIGFRIRSYDSSTNTTVCTDTTSTTITIAYPPCGVTFTVSGTGASRTFTASNPAATSGITYSWNYGDGNTGTGSPVTHTYATTGTYNVILTGSTGTCSYNDTLSIFVYIPPPPLNCANLHASFSASVSGNIATFTNTSNVASGAYQTIGSWDYGDGSTGAGYNSLPHTYTATGVYTIKLVMQWKDSLNTTSCKDSVTKTISITTIPLPANIISGNIIYDTTQGTTFFKVFLFRYDSVAKWLSPVDSTLTGNTSSPYYAFGNKPAGNYRVKAIAQNGTSIGTGFVPAYHDSSVYWSNAKVILHAGSSTINKRIYVPRGLSTPGLGAISGNVSYGSNKGTAGSGVSNLLIFLRNANMRVVQMAVTDSNGNYSFPNIAYGPYSVWPELINYATIPVTPLQLNATYPSRNDIDFTLDDSRYSIWPKGYLSVAGPNATSGFISVTPVPATDHVTITWSGASDNTARFIITSMTGQIVVQTGTLQGHAGTVQVGLTGVARGVYFVHGSGALAAHVVRLVVE
jgi:PKD repeat protein